MESVGFNMLSLFPILLGFFSLSVSAYILWWNYRDPANQVFSFIAFGLGIWFLITGMMWQAPRPEEAQVLANIRFLGTLFMPALTLHFALAFSRHPFYQRYPYLIILVYLPSFVFLPSALGGEYVLGVTRTWFGYEVVFSASAVPFLLWFLIGVFLGLAILGTAYLRAPRQSIVRRQLGIVWIGMALPYGVAIFSFALSSVVGEVTPPIATISASLFSFPLYIHALRRYGLFRLTSLGLVHVFQKLQEGVSVSDFRFHLTEGNAAFWKITGESPKEALGQPLETLFERALPEMRPLVQEVKAHPHSFLHRDIEDQRRGRYFQVSVYPIEERGGLLGHAWIFQDITERVQAFRELEETLRWVQGLLEFSTYLLSTLDRREAMERALETAVRVVGGEIAVVFLYHEDREVLKLEAHRGFPELYLRRFSEAKLGERVVGKVAQTREMILIEDALRDPKATPEVVRILKYRSLVAVPLVSQDRLIGVLAVLSSQPRRFHPRRLPFFRLLGNLLGIAIHNAQLYGQLREAVEKLRKTQEMLIEAEKEAAIGRLVAGLAHEVNNPLTPILGFSQLLLEQETLPEEVREMLRVIEQNALRIRSIVHGLLAFVRRYPSRKEPLDINDVVRSVLGAYRHRIQGEGIQIEEELAPSLPLVTGDFDQLVQVFLNLLLNAEEALLGQNQSAQRIIRIQTKADPDAQKVFLVVEDSGPGVPPNLRSRIFEPFYTTKEVGKGTGLGLAIARGIVEDHQGTIEVGESSLGGARFQVTLPALSV